MTQALNFLRDVSRYIKPRIQDAAAQYPIYASLTAQILDEAAKAPKFILPVGGRIFEDNLRGLPRDLRLPFPKIVIEYEAGDGRGIIDQLYPGSLSFPKRCVYANEQDGWIHVMGFIGNGTEWTLMPYLASMRANDGTAVIRDSEILDRTDAVSIDSVMVKVFPLGDIPITRPDWELCARADINDETNAVLSLIEALACINVGHETLPARKCNKNAAKRGALPFDEYRILVVRQTGSKGGVGLSHRSPREHLRRGHIRRMQNGTQIWVNACVVSAGAGGRVTTCHDLRRVA